mmetsp:Transcript_35907/g.85622  ORF Transcript_35907/g.85622 Transcript_35907/m.85622 type:complete len:104 (+) Transcript_35907:512-823(+)
MQKRSQAACKRDTRNREHSHIRLNTRPVWDDGADATPGGRGEPIPRRCAMRPSCVAVSRWRGLVLTLRLEEGRPQSSSGIGDEETTTKSSCVKDWPLAPSSHS